VGLCGQGVVGCQVGLDAVTMMFHLGPPEASQRGPLRGLQRGNQRGLPGP